MEYRFLGRSGLKVSALSYGSWVTFGDQIEEEQAYECMQAAYEQGVNFFDNAEAYAGGQSEIVMGNIIQRAGWERSDLILSTKIFWGGDGVNDQGLTFKHIREGTDAALERLQTDYVDLIFCHRPDFYTPVDETVRAMDQIIREGKAFYWGTSQWPAERIREAYHIARRENLRPPLMEQPKYNMVYRDKVEREYKGLYEDIGLGTTAWSPLEYGVLAGKYEDGIPQGSRLTMDNYQWLRERLLETERGKENLEKARQLKSIADDLGVTRAQLAIAWCLKNTDVSTVITGASRPEQVEENMKALHVVEQLNDEVMERIEGILKNRPDSYFKEFRR